MQGALIPATSLSGGGSITDIKENRGFSYSPVHRELHRPRTGRKRNIGRIKWKPYTKIGLILRHSITPAAHHITLQLPFHSHYRPRTDALRAGRRINNGGIHRELGRCTVGTAIRITLMAGH